MATSGVGILALIGGTRSRGKKKKGAGVSQFQVHDSKKILQKGVVVSVGRAGKMAA